MTRAEAIKAEYMKTGCFIDDGQFECGSQIAFEMGLDMKAMSQALRYINEYIEQNPIKTFGDISMKNAKEILEKRINAYPIEQ